MIAGNADVPSALSATREKVPAAFDIGNNALGSDADETSAFPALTGVAHPGSTLLSKATAIGNRLNGLHSKTNHDHPG
jgi:hypothetical protein